MNALYDTIGAGYALLRRPDPRIAALIHAQLEGVATVLNVGAGAGSYEPAHLKVTAVEPSLEMIRQRPPGEAVVIQAVAEDLPFEHKSFDAAMAVLTVHHWSDLRKGLSEMRRVTRGPIVILDFDPLVPNFWLLDYLPQLAASDEKRMSRLTDIEEMLGPMRHIPVPIPHDCTDGLLCAYWRRPKAYLDPKVRSAISPFWKIGDITEPLRRLESDLKSGEWERKYSKFLDKEECDFGYRLLVAGPNA